MGISYRIVEVSKILGQENRTLMDVRSPGEYSIGHVPGSYNLPLFTNDERAQVGVCYKTQGPQEAFLLGLDIVGPKMRLFINEALQMAPHGNVTLYCWRGGKRSQSMAWLLQNAGFDVAVIDGGYKSYRSSIHAFFEAVELDMYVLGGKTGTAKTEILSELQKFGEPVVDLEALAHHKGSAFGWIGECDQPSNEQFENNLYVALSDIAKTHSYVWIENESRTIGRNYIPDALWLKMKNSTLVNIERNLDTRLCHLQKCYNRNNADELVLSFKKIEKRLGYEATQLAIDLIQEGRIEDAALIALSYYDKCYEYNLKTNKSPHIFNFDFAMDSVEIIAQKIIDKKELIKHG